VIILGLLLIAAAVAAVTGVAVSSTNTAHVEVFGHSAHAHQVNVIFIAGAIAGIVFALGCSMVFGALGRRRARRREARKAEKARLAEQRALRDRNAELEHKLATEKAATPTTNSPHAVDLTTTDNDTEQRYAGQQTTR
jgi:hypothetical protein